MYKLSDFGAARQLQDADQSFISIYGTEEYLVGNLNYSTRNQLGLDIPRLSLEFSKNNFVYSGVKIWNDIPLPIRTRLTITTFKRKLKELLQN